MRTWQGPPDSKDDVELRAEMKVDMVADMKVDMVADMKVDMVADKKVHMVADMFSLIIIMIIKYP